MYRIRLSESVEDELSGLRARDRRIILDAIERQLAHEPSVPTRNRKMLEKLIPPFEAVPPVWELRVGADRVFYDVDSPARAVYVRAIRKKPPRATTEDAL